MKKKLLITMDTYYPKTDGVLRFISEIIPRIHHKFSITLLVPDFGQAQTPAVEEFCTVVRLPTYKKFGAGGHASAKWGRKNRKIVLDQVKKADKIWVQDAAPIGLATIYYAKQEKKFVASFVHQILWDQYAATVPKPLKGLARWFIKKTTLWSFRNSSLLMVPYPQLIDQLKELGLSNEMEEVRLGVNTDTFVPAQDKAQAKEDIDISPRSTVIGYVGRLSKEKHVEVLLDSFLSLRKKFRNLYLLIVGDGVAEIVNKFKGVKDVQVTGFVRNVTAYLQAMDIFVMPSLTETTSLATLEAMSAQLPVVTTRVGYLKEYVVKGHNGITVPSSNQANLTLALKKLIINPQLREEMGRHGRHLAHAFSWDKAAHKISRLLS